MTIIDQLQPNSLLHAEKAHSFKMYVWHLFSTINLLKPPRPSSHGPWVMIALFSCLSATTLHCNFSVNMDITLTFKQPIDLWLQTRHLKEK